jgi:hypothetical protein
MFFLTFLAGEAQGYDHEKKRQIQDVFKGNLDLLPIEVVRRDF